MNSYSRLFFVLLISPSGHSTSVTWFSIHSFSCSHKQNASITIKAALLTQTVTRCLHKRTPQTARNSGLTQLFINTCSEAPWFASQTPVMEALRTVLHTLFTKVVIILHCNEKRISSWRNTIPHIHRTARRRQAGSIAKRDARRVVCRGKPLHCQG